MIEQRCVEKGLRMTEQRRVIARVLSTAADHPDAEELLKATASQAGSAHHPAAKVNPAAIQASL